MNIFFRYAENYYISNLKLLKESNGDMKRILKILFIVFLVLIQNNQVFSRQIVFDMPVEQKVNGDKISAGIRIPAYDPLLLNVDILSFLPQTYRSAATVRLDKRMTLPVFIQSQASQGGGFIAGLKSILFGPRVGLEANENQSVSFIEKANLFIPIAPFQAYSTNGIKGFLTSAFFGPRVGMEIGERKIRRKEWIGLVPVVLVAYHLSTSNPGTSTVIVEAAAASILSRLWSALDAFKGKTMTEIELSENLKK